ncbi:hypothetical protein [Rheinheimera tilapiae]|uniref:Uncharacterized protein n=1 Tax=Rheinheimera tilapiae TaxID=875043 RepID=A0ABV6BCI3_9GAMM
MALHNDIFKDIQANKVNETFSPSDLKHTPLSDGRFLVGGNPYAESSINTAPANLAIHAYDTEVGNHVKKGSKPQYVAVKRGKYRLHCAESQLVSPIMSDDEVTGDDIISSTADEQYSFSGCTSVADYLVKYLAEQPFQLFFKKQRAKHPLKPAVGIRARLKAYFWPNLANDWFYTSQIIQDIVARFKAIEQQQHKYDCAENLLKLFAEICQWGGVRLPTISAEQLKFEVFSVLASLDKGEVPSQQFRLNSAFTKLYAIARPEIFVIFDSRVAAALTSIIDSNFQVLVQMPEWERYQQLGFVNGRGGSRPRLLSNPWPSGYQKWTAQIAANRLCLDMLQIINQQPTLYGALQPITLRELEAILFMEGY